MEQALDRIQAVLPLRGRVVLNSLDNLYLYAIQEYAPGNGHVRILDEAQIVALRSSARIRSLFLLPQLLPRDFGTSCVTSKAGFIEAELTRMAAMRPTANPRAIECLAEADLILFGPGTQHSSLLPTYLTEGLPDCIAANKQARKILVCNTGEDHDTRGYTAADIHRLTLDYLARGWAGTMPPKPWDLLTDVLVNLPGTDRAGAIQPNLNSFESCGYCELWRLDEPSAVAPNRVEVRVVLCDLEDPAEPSRHSIQKLAAVLPQVLDGHPAWQQRVRRLLTRGAIIFDVDETILEVRVDRNSLRYEQTLLEAPVLHVLVELLEAGFRLCAIAGNEMKGFHRRFTEHFLAHLGNRGRLDLIGQFEVYADGAARHATFQLVDGVPTLIPDEACDRSHAIPDADYAIIKEVLDQVASIPALIPARDVLSATCDLAVWKYHFEPATGRWFEDNGDGNQRPLPTVHERGERIMLTLKPIPSHRHLLPSHKSGPGLRRNVLEMVRERMRERLGPLYSGYLVREAGWSSIDVTMGASKATAELQSPHLRQIHSVIQEKIEALYRDKIARHERVLGRGREASMVDRFFAAASRLAVVDSLIRLQAAGQFTLIIPAGGASTRLQADRIAIVVRPQTVSAFADLLEDRPQQTNLLTQETPTGDWQAVKIAADHLRPMRGHVIVAWADLVIANPSKIRESLEAHLSNGAGLTLPTAFEREPYAAVLRGPDRRPTQFCFRNEQLGGPEGYLEHDCGFFIFRAEALTAALNWLEDEGRKAAPGGEPVRFTDCVRMLHAAGVRVDALPICRPGDFMAFNERFEADQIAALINRIE